VIRFDFRVHWEHIYGRLLFYFISSLLFFLKRKTFRLTEASCCMCLCLHACLIITNFDTVYRCLLNFVWKLWNFRRKYQRCKWKYCVIWNLCSQTYVSAEWGWRYIGVCIFISWKLTFLRTLPTVRRGTDHCYRNVMTRKLSCCYKVREGTCMRWTLCQISFS
jgi:hypothetical protein